MCVSALKPPANMRACVLLCSGITQTSLTPHRPPPRVSACLGRTPYPIVQHATTSTPTAPCAHTNASTSTHTHTHTQPQTQQRYTSSTARALTRNHRPRTRTPHRCTRTFSSVQFSNCSTTTPVRCQPIRPVNHTLIWIMTPMCVIWC